MSLQIIINNQKVALSDDIELIVKKYNPLFKDRNEDATYPLTLDLGSNRHIFGFPERWNNKEFYTSYPAQVLFGPYVILNGKCVISDINDTEIEVCLMTDMTSFWSVCKNRYLDELDLGGESFSNIAAMMTAFTSSLEGNKDYVVCPLFDEYAGNIYIDLYEPFYNYLHPDTSPTFKDRILPTGKGTCVFTPFVRLSKLVLKVFDAMEYRIIRNDMASDVLFNDILLICRANGMHSYNLKPGFNYNKRVPHILVSDLLEEIENKFGYRFLVDDNNKSVSIVSFCMESGIFSLETQDSLSRHLIEEEDRKSNFIFKDKENPDIYIQEYYEDAELEYVYGSSEDAESIECISGIVGCHSVNMKMGWVNSMAVGAQYENDTAYLQTVRTEFRLAVYRGFICEGIPSVPIVLPYPMASPEPFATPSTQNNISLLWFGKNNLFSRFHKRQIELIANTRIENEMVIMGYLTYITDLKRLFSDVVLTRNMTFRCYEYELRFSTHSVVECILRCYNEGNLSFKSLP